MLILLVIFAWAASARIPPPPPVHFTNWDQFITRHDDGNTATLTADPRNNITCLGDHTDIPWVYHHYDGRSMQKLCALSFYGGTEDPGLNLGGYCEEHDVAFLQRGWTVSATAMTTKRFLRPFLECRNRCFCNYGLQDPLQQPKQVPITRKTFSGPLPTENQAFGGGAQVIPVDRMANAQKAHPSLVTRLLLNAEILQPNYQKDVGILPANMIECGGPLPTFDLPSPWLAADFANNTQLCAVQLSGGSAAANAGGYCHRDSTDGTTAVAFADDMTPRWDWTWSSSETFLNTASLRFHCWKNCLCFRKSRKPNYDDPLIPMWDYLLKRLPENGFSHTKGNRNPLGSSTDAKGKLKTSATGGNSRTAQCAVARATRAARSDLES
ncbi:MAG: hypothetical protein Q9168_003858 [Polycauliona sp. 1 TL-2023]